MVDQKRQLLYRLTNLYYIINIVRPDIFVNDYFIPRSCSTKFINMSFVTIRFVAFFFNNVITVNIENIFIKQFFTDSMIFMKLEI